MAKITGLDKLNSQFKEASRALQELEGVFSTVEFNPSDQLSVGAAVAEMRKTVDGKLSRFRGNPIVGNLAEQTKATFEKKIYERAEQLRSAKT